MVPMCRFSKNADVKEELLRAHPCRIQLPCDPLTLTICISLTPLLFTFREQAEVRPSSLYLARPCVLQ
jgi:hypothetical protein